MPVLMFYILLDNEPTLNAKSRYPAYMVSRGGSLTREDSHLKGAGYCSHCDQHSGGSLFDNIIRLSTTT